MIPARGVESDWTTAAASHRGLDRLGGGGVLTVLRRALRQQVELRYAALRRVAAGYLDRLTAGNLLMLGSFYFMVVFVHPRADRVKREMAAAEAGLPPAAEQDLAEAATLLLSQAEYELASNTAEAWLERVSMPQEVFDALDAYLGAFGRPTTREAEAERTWRRHAWLRRAIDNWHHSHDYRDDAGYPMIPLREGQRTAHRRLLGALTDPERGPEVARDLAEMSRLEWVMAIARGPADAPHSGNLPPVIVQDALDDYFAGYSTQGGGETVPSYPDLHLVSETVLRASMADYCPECPNPLQWSSGLPAPVKAALDALN
jgi:hypothetical protein